MLRLTAKARYTLFSALVLCMLVIGGTTGYLMSAHAQPVQRHFNHFLATHPNIGSYNADYEQYDNRAYPHTAISYAQAIGSYSAFQSISQRPFGLSASHGWQEIGPTTTNEPDVVTFTGHPTTISGRVTVLAIASSCTDQLCRVWVGAAGGGIWETDHGLSTTPDWHSSSTGLASNAIGSIVLDPTDPTGRILYAGTGEPNGSSDSEAGVGLYKSFNYGRTWKLLPGSIPAAKDRSIGAIAIDPTNPLHIYIGTDVARHGSSSENGGRFTPPDAPVVGLYESLDGGLTFKLVFSKETDVVNPGSPNGSDFFRGGVTSIQFNTTGLAAGQPPQIYFSMFDYGLFRSNNGSFEQVFASAGGGSIASSSGSRTQFALAPNGSKLRIYLVDSDATTGNLYRIDNANVPASTLTDGTNNPGWLKLSNPTPGTAGFASYNFCTGQCWYDMWVASPSGHPDTVWIGGSMQYGELGASSNGRAVQRSTDAGVDFTDMTDDSESPPLGMHPDQHAVVFVPGHPDIAILGSDGGVVRTDGTFVNASSQCAGRGLTGANLTDCQHWLSAIPTQLFSLNPGLATLQFQSLTVNPQAPGSDLIGGTQDNGTLAYSGSPTWFESVGGDGGQSSISVGDPNIRMHMYFGTTGDVNFHGDDTHGWDYMTGPLDGSGEAASFYIPLIGDPQVSGTDFAGLGHVWRTQDNAGSQAVLDLHCNELTGDFPANVTCGDWVPLGPNLVNSTFGSDKLGSYVVAISRASSNTGTLWVGTRRGRLFISTNANGPAGSVTFTRIDTPAQPTRFISGIAVDPADPFHAFVSFSGYNAYTPTTPGHVFDVHYNPSTGTATWTDISHNLGDQPITGIAYDAPTGRLFASTDFGVAVLFVHSVPFWFPAAPGLPRAAVYGLTISTSGRVLYAATHGRGAWRLKL